ncbi:hypothetical protein CYY_003611 [Polysphondylium violaceum]|uniref:DNA mismatch repair proteins mutS family domain-containing protein n=1 Tax=Polysphondylium violaceum TaxID=133409 RepID=A0A8J4UU66_9MYCE|nr:hypothetical protein CYY_003611 [Polysphondylium violaceum]
MSDTEDSSSQTTTQAVVLKEDKGFVSFFQTLDDTDTNTIKLFDRKGYYSLHGQDAVFVSLMHFKTKKSLKYWTIEQAKKKLKTSNTVVHSKSNNEDDEEQEDGLAYLTIRQGVEYETIIKELFDEKKKIEIWGNRPNRANQWEIIKKGSPGNIQMFEDVIQTNIEGSCMMALKIAREKGTLTFGIAFGDATFKTLGLSQFVDNDHLSNLSSFIMQMSIKECLIYNDLKSYDHKKVTEKLEEAGIPITIVPKADFNSKNVDQDLTRLLGNISNNLIDLEQEHAIQSVSCLIKHLELLSNANFFGKFKLEKFDLEKYMRLDPSSFKGLHIIESKEATKDQSLYSLLNQCNTPMGSRLLLQWVKQPLIDTDEIEVRLNFVDAFYNDLELRESLRANDLKKVGDLDRLAKKFYGQKSSLEDCVNLYGTTQRLPVLLSSLRNYSGTYQEILQINFVEPLTGMIQGFKKFAAMVETTIDLDLANDKHEYVIRATFNEDLKKMQDKKNEISKKIESTRLNVSDAIGLDESKVKLHYTDKDGYLLRISRKDEPSIRKNTKCIVYATQKDGVRFSTKELGMLNEAYTKISAAYQEKQSGIAKRALEIAASFVPLIEDLSSLIATLDVFVTMAHVSSISPIPYVRPTVHPLGQGSTEIVGGRHPCVEIQDGVSFIPNDISLVRDESQFQIITGPNMGGKSTFIRQVGLIVLMAQIGCFVPCQEASISVVDCILSRVGAGDSQLRGVSTFMAEMLETSYILKVATKNSLIIIDELGRGTSTYDGFGLAWGIAEYICNQIGGFCLFATHFHELTVLEEMMPMVKNLHVAATADNNTFTLLYKVEKGSCDQSFGIHVAVLADFPKEVIDLAKLKAKELESFESNTLKKNYNQFLDEFKEIDLNNADQEKTLSLVQNLLSKYSIDINN